MPPLTRKRYGNISQRPAPRRGTMPAALVLIGLPRARVYATPGEAQVLTRRRTTDTRWAQQQFKRRGIEV